MNSAGELSLKSTISRFSLMQAVFYGSYAALFAFSVALAREKGISTAGIGVMAALYRVGSVCGQTFWGALSDRIRNNRRVFILANSLAFFCAAGFYLALNTVAAVGLYALLGFVQTPCASLLDAWVIACLRKFDSNAYGPVRGWGSVGYAVLMLVFGTMTAKLGYLSIEICGIALAVLLTLLALWMPEGGRSRSIVRMNAADVWNLLKISEYRFLLAVLFLDGLTVFSLMQMKALVWEDMHASIAFQGYDGSACAIAEIPFMMLAGRLSGTDPKKRLTAGILCDLAMLVITLQATAPQVVVAASAVWGIGYSLILSSMRQIITRIAPDNVATTAQTLGDAVFGSLSTVLGSLMAGIIIGSAGMKSFLFVCVLIEIVPAVLLIRKLFAK